jgi:hypothetical protein
MLLLAERQEDGRTARAYLRSKMGLDLWATSTIPYRPPTSLRLLKG